MVRITPQQRSATALRRAAEGRSERTIVIALIANIIIAIAKLIGGLVSGSTGMLAEAAHSAADSVNEIFLAIGLHRAGQPADAAHPLGHGREGFLWAFMAAISSFLIGGCLSIAMAIAELKARHPVTGGLTAWIILGIAFTADGVSWLQSMRQASSQAREYGMSVWRYIFRSSDPVVRAVAVEDSAALIGVFVAAIGLLLSKILRSSVPDSLASLVIGLLLAVTAFGLARPLADFLVGRSLPLPLLQKLHEMIEEDPAIEEILSLRAMYSGPEEVIVMAKVRPSKLMNIEQLTRAMDDLDRRIRLALPIVADIFIDVTGSLTEENSRLVT
ncbi:MAG: cation diffusion facilitator family transporter [Candidatus Angelobacter sp.]|jgi:cation diffusion facilitator family transporter|nr:cation diffusion facilitator family transporter [Candidatus Angelobacter sp.]